MIMYVIMVGRAFKRLSCKGYEASRLFIELSLLIKHDTNDTEGKQALWLMCSPILQI